MKVVQMMFWTCPRKPAARRALRGISLRRGPVGCCPAKSTSGQSLVEYVILVAMMLFLLGGIAAFERSFESQGSRIVDLAAFEYP